jgi:hypothetical protein
VTEKPNIVQIVRTSIILHKIEDKIIVKPTGYCHTHKYECVKSNLFEYIGQVAR